jgi:MtN3 and saliva related transmembrane protein
MNIAIATKTSIFHGNNADSGIVAGILTSVSMLPQLIKIIKEKSRRRVDSHVLILIGGLGLWATYGFMKTTLL